jgi:hypothetical protein
MEGITVNAHIGKVCLGIVMALIMLNSACLVANEPQSNTLAIASMGADYMAVYPRGMSEIKCVTSAPGGDTVQYVWSSDGGSVTGEGSTVLWQAPNEYGDFHVMVTAKDNNGGKAEGVLTLSVVPRPHKSCCGRKLF